MLDPRGRKGLREVCATLHRAGLTIIMITHFMDEAARAERVVALKDGRIVADGSPRTVLGEPASLTSLSLEAPFAVRVSGALRAAGVAIPVCLTEDELVEALVPLRTVSES